MNFITLKSGAVVNTANIIHVTQSEHQGQIKLVLTDEPTPWLESMSLADFQALLRGPAQTPIASPIVNLDDLKPGKACCFTREGVVRHGLIEYFDYTLDGVPGFKVTSDGETYFKPIQ